VANYETIRSYLVELGYKIDDLSSRKFEDALKRSAVMTERFAKGAVKDFAIVGGTFATVAAAVVAGTVAMGTTVANRDLQFQMFARRMFMGLDAAKKMKIATDALGVSLEEIIWGPPELAERYHQLIKDETKMLEMLGGDRGEGAFRRIRDIEFQFTRVGVGLQFFAMRLTEDVMNKLFGGTESLEKRMENFVTWFERSIPTISGQLTNILGPALKRVGAIAEWALEKLGLATPGPKYSRGYFNTHPGGYSLEQLAPPGSMSSLTEDQQSEETGRRGFGPHPWVGRMKELLSGHNYIQEIIEAAHKYGIPPALLMAIARKESGLDPFKSMGSRGEIGEFQLMPDTVRQLIASGIITDPYDPSQNIIGGAYWLKNKPGKSWEEKVRQYNGKGADAESYQRDVMRQYHADPTYSPMSYSPTVHVGGITISQPGATPEHIQRIVYDAIDRANRDAARRAFAQRTGAYV